MPSLPTLQKTFQTSIGLFKEAYLSLDINIRKTKVINLLLASMQDLPKLKYLEKFKKMLNTSRIYEVTCPRKPPLRQKLNTVSAAPERPSGNCATEYLMTTTSGKRWRWWSTKPFVLPIYYTEERLFCYLSMSPEDPGYIPSTLPQKDASHPVGRPSHQCQRPH